MLLALADDAQAVREVRRVVLVEGVDPRVAQRNALQVDDQVSTSCLHFLVSVKDVLCHGRDVVACVRLAGHKERSAANFSVSP